MTDRDTQATDLRVLVVDDEENIRSELSACLEADGHQVNTCATSTEALAEAGHRAFDLILLDLESGAANGLDLIPRLMAESPWTKVVPIAANASVETAVEAMKRGAADYLPKPLTEDQVRQLTRRVAEQRATERHMDTLRALGATDPDAEFPAASAAMRRSLELARRIAPSNATLLIHGETGTGKTRLAHAIHQWSGRPATAFATACCQAAEPDALEAELFGIWSTRDAENPPDHAGRVAFCEGGTLVLTGIGNAPLSLQPKLLRLLHDKEYERQNDFLPRRADIRVIATCSDDLHEAARRGTFRQDLLLAVDVVTIEIPPLRQRPDDIRLLAERYLAFFSREYNRPISGFTDDALDSLLRHSYPGNARELRNLVERAVLLCNGGLISREHLPPNLLNAEAHAVGDLVALDTIADLHIRRVLASTRSFEAAASILGINSSTLWRRRKRYGL